MDQTNTAPGQSAPQQTPPSGNKGSILHQLEMWLDLYLGQKAPRIPDNWRENIVKVAPWITLILLVIALPAMLFLFTVALGLSAVSIPFAYGAAGAHFGGMLIVTFVLTLVSLILEVLALPGLFHKQRKGWLFLFYSTLIGGVLNIVSFHIGGLIGTVLGLYLLFQIRSYYK